jgi:Mor family transcriptional regulator
MNKLIPECELLDFLSKEFGEKVAQKTWERFAGSQIYVPSVPSASQRERYVLENYNGENVRELARQTSTTDKTVYMILSKKKISRQA